LVEGVVSEVQPATRTTAIVRISSSDTLADLNDNCIGDGYCSTPIDGVSNEAARLLGFEIAPSS